MAKAKKAQMSLEMIIGLLILLVVAVVVIRIFLGSMKGATSINPDKELEQIGFYGDCENLCSDYLASGSKAMLANYCTKTISMDFNGDSMTDKIKANTKFIDICEDSIYCFQMVECETGYGKIDWSDCRQVVCEAYEETFPDDMQRVDKKVSDTFSLGKCTGIRNDENWIKLYFNQGDNKPCSNPPTGQKCIVSFDSCVITPGADPSKPSFSCISEHSELIPTGDCDPKEFGLGIGAYGKDGGGNTVNMVFLANPGFIENGNPVPKGTVSFATPNVITGTLELFNCMDNNGNSISCPAGSTITSSGDCAASLYYKLLDPIFELTSSDCSVV